MKLDIEKFRVKPGDKVDLAAISTKADPKADKNEVENTLFPALKNHLESLQEKLWAENKQSIILVLHGMDAAGKDSTVRHVFTEVDPAGMWLASFKAPTVIEKDHDYLWRVNRALPPRGMIGVFNRSHYEDVVTVRLHNYIKDRQLPDEIKNDEHLWDERFDQIRNWEKYLRQNAFRMVKIFLHVSKDEQQKRLTDRLFNEEKHYKFSLSDLEERRYWPEYQKLYAETIEETTTEHSPWYIVPADNKWYHRYVVGTIVEQTLEAMNPKFPPLSDETKAKLGELRNLLTLAKDLNLDSKTVEKKVISQVIAKDAAPAEAHALVEAVKEIEEVKKEEKKDDSKKGDKKDKDGKKDDKKH